MTKFIKISDIRKLPESHRISRISDPDIIELAESIKTSGLQDMFTVCERVDSNNKVYYVVVNGQRRLTALNLLLQTKEIPEEIECIVVSGLSDDEILINQITTNFNTKMSTKKQFIDTAWKFIRKGMGYDELVEKFSISKDRLMSLLSTVTLPENVRGMLDAGIIKLGHATALAQNINYLPESIFNELVEIAQVKTVEEFKDEVVSRVNEWKTGRAASFQPDPIFRKQSEIKAKFDELRSAPQSKTIAAQISLLEWMYSIDSNTLKARAEAFESKKNEKANKEKEKVEHKKEKTLEELLATMTLEEAISKLTELKNKAA